MILDPHSESDPRQNLTTCREGTKFGRHPSLRSRVTLRTDIAHTTRTSGNHKTSSSRRDKK